MSILDFFRKDRCKICKVNRGSRFCMRIGKDICWRDCNKTRIDMKCPNECEYVLKKTEDFNLKAKADSLMEYRDLLKKQIDKWIYRPQEIFDNEIPKDMAKTEQGNRRLTEFFSGFKFTSLIPINYLKEKLYLDDLKVKDDIKNYEHHACEFLDRIIAQEWDKLVDYLHYPEKIDNQIKDFLLNHIRNKKIFANLSDYELISSAVTKEKDQALVHFELNSKRDLTIKFKKIDDKWKIRQKILAEPKYFNSENEAIQQVAVLLSKNELSKAFELLKKFSGMFIDSADFEYYLGLYYSFSKNARKAKIHFRNATMLDPEFIEAAYNYAYTLHAENEIEGAKKIYHKILKKVPTEPKTLNNLASIYIEEKKYHRADGLLKQCLKEKPDFKLAQDNQTRLKELLKE